jgi:7-keto-8-aminopelargonate synthetase-like enzyme
LQAQGIHVETLRHGKLDLLRERYEALKQTHEHVWYMVDGVYSMQGDLAPIPELRAMLEELDQLYLYVDDAHGMSWTGKHGCGYAMSHGPIHPKMVVTVSLWKSFGAQGGAIVFPNKEWRNLVRVAGSSLIFSGPIPPMSLAAAVASAKIHLSEEIHEMQRALQSKIQYFNERAAALDLMLLHHNISPVKMIGLGKEDVTMALTSGLIQKGYYVNGVGYPSVPLNQSGLRITITNHVSLEDIDGLLTNMRMMLNEAYEVRNINEEKVKRSFTRNRTKVSAISAGKAES